MATTLSNGTGGGDWSAGATWAGGVAPADGDSVTIVAGDTVTVDTDMSALTGFLTVQVNGHASTPGLLRFKYDADGVYTLPIRTGGRLMGTTVTNRGRVLANSDGIWANSGAIPNGRQCTIDLRGTALVELTDLDMRLYCTQPANLSATVYGTKLAVTGIDTGTDVLTCASPHGWSANTPVMVRSSGALPAPLLPDYVYYVTSPSGADLKLAPVSSGVALDITSAGSGTIEVYSGHTSTSTGTVNVLEDLTSDAPWSTTAGRNSVVLVDAAAPSDYDQQRLTLGTINPGSLVLSANVDSAQYPGAKVWLASRNVRIVSNSTSSSQALVQNGTGAVLQCEIRNTAGSGTTFYQYGVNSGTSHTISGTISGCSRGVYYGTSHTISGTITGCTNGVYYGTSYTISGTISGCSNGVSSSTSHTISGTITGCTSGVIFGTSNTISGTISGCTSGVYSGTSHTISGTISGCSSGVYYGTSYTISGTISGCSNGVYSGASNTISGTVSGCTYGVIYGTVVMRGGSFANNVRDLYLCTSSGGPASLNSSTQNGLYKHSQVGAVQSRFTCLVRDLGGVSGALGCWTSGGYVKSEAYAVGTHGIPPVDPPDALIHVMTAEDNEGIVYLELPIELAALRPCLVTLYGKLTGTTSWTARPRVGLYDQSKDWQAVDEAFAESDVMASNTDWQVLTCTYVPNRDRYAYLRVQAVGGNAGGTGTEQLYFFYTIQPGLDFTDVLAAIAALNDFNPAADTVAHVALVDTTTTNTDMVTDVAADVTSILEDTGTTLDILVKDIPTNAELATALAGADDATLAAIAALPDDTDIAALDALLDAIKIQTDTIGALEVTVTSPVSDTGTVTVEQGDSYPTAHGRSGVIFTVADAAHSLGLDGVDCTVSLRLTQATWTAHSVASTGDGYTVTFEPTVAQTQALTVARQTYKLVAEYSGTPDDVSTLATGTWITNADIPEVV